MNLSEIAEEVARRVGSSKEEAWGFIDEAVKLMAIKLDSGEDINLRGIGVLSWVPVQGRQLYSFKEQQSVVVEDGYKLRFRPSRRFETRRSKPNEPRQRRRNDKAGGRSR